MELAAATSLPKWNFNHSYKDREKVQYVLLGMEDEQLELSGLEWIREREYLPAHLSRALSYDHRYRP